MRSDTLVNKGLIGNAGSTKRAYQTLGQLERAN